MNPEIQDCIIIPGRIPPHRIGFVNALLDDHDGVVVVRTVEPVEGRMEFWVAPALLNEFHEFVRFMNEKWSVPIEVGDPIPQSTEIEEFEKKSKTKLI